MSEDTEPIDPDSLQRYSDEFTDLQQLRHEKGAEEYGPVSFLTNPLVTMAAEELADLCNYARYMYIRLRLLEEQFRASGIDMSTGSVEEIRGTDEVSPDASTFIPGASLSRFLPDEESGG